MAARSCFGLCIFLPVHWTVSKEPYVYFFCLFALKTTSKTLSLLKQMFVRFLLASASRETTAAGPLLVVRSDRRNEQMSRQRRLAASVSSVASLCTKRTCSCLTPQQSFQVVGGSTCSVSKTPYPVSTEHQDALSQQRAQWRHIETQVFLKEMQKYIFFMNCI